jgi:hypothetical protein
LKRDVAQVAVRDDLFDTFSGFCRQDMTENGHKRHEHQTLLSPATPTRKTQVGRRESRALDCSGDFAIAPNASA